MSNFGIYAGPLQTTKTTNDIVDFIVKNKRDFSERMQALPGVNYHRQVLASFSAQVNQHVSDTSLIWKDLRHGAVLDNKLQRYRNPEEKRSGYILGKPVIQTVGDIERSTESVVWETNLISHNDFDSDGNNITRDKRIADFRIMDGNVPTAQLRKIFGEDNAMCTPQYSTGLLVWNDIADKTAFPNKYMHAFGATLDNSPDSILPEFELEMGTIELNDNVQLEKRINERDAFYYYQGLPATENDWNNRPFDKVMWDIPIPSSILTTAPTNGTVIADPAIIPPYNACIRLERDISGTVLNKGLVGSGTGKYIPQPPKSGDDTDGLVISQFANRKIAYTRIYVRYDRDPLTNKFAGKKVTFWWFYNHDSTLVISSAEGGLMTLPQVSTLNFDLMTENQTTFIETSLNLHIDAVANNLTPVFVEDIFPDELNDAWGYSSTSPAYTTPSAININAPGRLSWYVITTPPPADPDYDSYPNILADLALPKTVIFMARVGGGDIVRENFDFTEAVELNTVFPNHESVTFTSPISLPTYFGLVDTGGPFIEQNFSSFSFEEYPAIQTRVTCLEPIGVFNLEVPLVSQSFIRSDIQDFLDSSINTLTELLNRGLTQTEIDALVEQRAILRGSSGDMLAQVSRSITSRGVQLPDTNISFNLTRLSKILTEIASVTDEVAQFLITEDQTSPFGLGLTYMGDYGASTILNLITSSEFMNAVQLQNSISVDEEGLNTTGLRDIETEEGGQSIDLDAEFMRELASKEESENLVAQVIALANAVQAGDDRLVGAYLASITVTAIPIAVNVLSGGLVVLTQDGNIEIAGSKYNIDPELYVKISNFIEDQYQKLAGYPVSDWLDRAYSKIRKFFKF